MNKKLLAKFKKALTQKKASITNKLNSKKVDEIEIETGGDEIDTAIQSAEREMQFELSGIDKRMVQDIDNALAKIEKGVFGYCESCELSCSENCKYNGREGICNKIDGNWSWVMIILLLL